MKKSILLWLATLSCYGAIAQSSPPKVLEIGKNASGVTIDGVLKETVWSNLQPITNQIDLSTPDCGVVSSINSANNTAKFGATYNDEYLIVGVEVKDLALTAGDGIDLFFSMDNDRTSNCPGNWPRAYNALTFMIIINPIDGTFSSPNGQVGNVNSLKVSLIPGGYTAEISLIWAEMDFLTNNLMPTLGRQIGFDIGINDGDDVKNGRTSQLMWNQSGGNRNWTESTNFGIIQLGSEVCSKPVIADVAKCGATAVTLTPQGGTEYFWYKSIYDATPFFKGNSYTTPVLKETTYYYVANNSSKCLSDRVQVKVAINLKAPEAINSTIYGTLSPCAGGFNEYNYSLTDYSGANYTWRSTGNIVRSNATSVDVIWPFAGDGKVTVFQTNGCGKGPEKSLSVLVQGAPQPKFTVSGPTSICPGSISTYEIVGDKDYNYSWSFLDVFGRGAQILSQTNTKATVKWEYSGRNYVSAYAYNNCGNSDRRTIAVDVISKPITPSICKLTADKTGSLIEVVGQKFYNDYYFQYTDTTQKAYKFIDSMFIYREGRRANQYSLIGAVGVAKGYSFVDQSSRPSQQEYRYKISFKDSCGNVSDLSLEHKTMYLAMNRGFAENVWNLVWTPYIGIYEIPTYEIYRGTSADKMEYLNSVSGNSTSFTDFEAPQGTSLFYQIRIADVNCGNGTDNEIRSNLINYNIITGMVGDDIVDAAITIFPNPSVGNFTVEALNTSGNVSVYNVLGEEVRRGNINASNSKLEVNGLASGIYSVEITKSKVKSRKTVVVR